MTHPPWSTTHCSPVLVMPPSLPLPLQNHLEVPACFCITLQTSPPTMRLQCLRLWSLNFPPVSPVHITPTSKACLLGASLTPALSPPGHSWSLTWDPSSCQYKHSGSTHQSRLPEFLLQMPIFFLHQPVYHDYILYCSWPCVLFAHLDVSVLTTEPHFLLLYVSHAPNQNT